MEGGVDWMMMVNIYKVSMMLPNTTRDQMIHSGKYYPKIIKSCDANNIITIEMRDDTATCNLTEP